MGDKILLARSSLELLPQQKIIKKTCFIQASVECTKLFSIKNTIIELHKIRAARWPGVTVTSLTFDVIVIKILNSGAFYLGLLKM